MQPLDGAYRLTLGCANADGNSVGFLDAAIEAAPGVALDYFRVITVFWTYETLSYYYLKSKFSDVQQKILHSALSALTLLSFFAFLIMSVENLDDIAWLSPLSEDDEWNAFTAFYFIMVNQLL